VKKILLAIMLCLIPISAYAGDGILTWTANTEADLAGYKIYFAPQSCTAQGPLAPLVVAGSPVQVGKVTTYKHVGLPVMDGTLCWEITAFDIAGNESGRSNRVSIVVNSIPPVPPVGLNAVIQ
jgi:hypothetical protein